jgi:perosamine synthetase
MWIQRTFPPTAAPLSGREIMEGLHGWFSEGRAEEKLKKELCDYFGVPDCWLVSSGKAALTLILKAIHSLSPGKKSVLMCAYTCYSVASSVVKAGLSVALSDINPDTLDFDYALLESQISEQTLCLVINHLLGRPADLDHCRALARSKGIWVVEDAAQAMGAVYQGKTAGTRGDVGFFSLGRGKVICAVEGGIIVTRNPDIAAALQREYQKLPPYTCQEKAILLAKAIALVCFLRPSFYWLPDHLPFLKLGQTEFSTRFSLKRMSGFQCGLMRRWREKLARLNHARLERTQLYYKLLGQKSIDQRSEDHRLPGQKSPDNMLQDHRPPGQTLLNHRLTRAMISAHGRSIDAVPYSVGLLNAVPCNQGLLEARRSGLGLFEIVPANPAPPEAVAVSMGLAGAVPSCAGLLDAVPSNLPSGHQSEPEPLPFLRFPLIVEDPKKRERLYQLARRQGLGISRMYPDSIDGIAQLKDQLIRGNYPAARKLAQTLLTLPTHPLISAKDQKRVIRLIRGGR